MRGDGCALAHEVIADVGDPYGAERTHPRHGSVEHGGRETEAPWAADEAATTDLSGLHVLLVEDDRLSREALEAIFSYHGARVTSVASAAEALAAFEQTLPGIVISDIGLPAEDGCALLRAIRIREFGRGRHTPAVAISAFPGRETSERAHGAGFDAFFPKPLEVPALLRAMHSLSVTTT
jgi:CheY-like chemotaxis protein